MFSSRRSRKELAPPIRRADSDLYSDVLEPSRSERAYRESASYYGPHFQDVERGRAASISGPRIQPEYPDPWERRPEQWTPDVQEEYAFYKGCGDAHGAHNKRYHAHAATKDDGKGTLPFHNQVVELSQQGRDLSNRHLAARAGFRDKFPYAYHSHHSTTVNHEIEITAARESSVGWRRKEAQSQKEIRTLDPRTRGPEYSGRKGISSKEWKMMKKEEKLARSRPLQM
ncbi:hypothetical protein AJ80_00234 [Polytolypa hystricis UAMH7299]|uniref:Uncharacterized protein n=1 Tax=Polytolypa hystricis (strain UAMH7299) TaxID=1447883 RepID=A0A2B7Z3J7_POLH7|nr:hypothetical protein AJ80_00234 [Polytolypa hystricis UAMH7299]